MKYKWRESMPLLAMSIIAILHLVGFFGLQSAYKQDFAGLTALNLLITFLLIIPFTQGKRSAILLFFTFTFCIGMGVEILGVHTEFPFGAYHYTQLLSLDVFRVPLLIGVNWFMLAYGILSLVNKIYKWGSLRVKSTIAALLMTLMDVLIEPFAIKHELWVWESHSVPLQNYAAWFFISFFIFLFGFKILPKEENKVAVFTVFTFFIFFGLNLLLN